MTLKTEVLRVCMVAAFALVAAATDSAAQPLPAAATHKHLGPASCASSVCHGKVAPDEQASVGLNEYRVWSRQGRHSQAYRLLQSELSREMARKLGLKSAVTADLCLDCHADNIPAGQRGEKFGIADGVGCEACHGGAEQWIESHAEQGATHAGNLERGMYPTEDPEARAKLCLSCHYGTGDRFADHDLMAAGHPRMSFELETFSANQPAHFIVDEDYIERKGRIESVNMWVTGMLFKARRELELMRSDVFEGHGLFPELAFFDCHACHHAMDEGRLRPLSVTRNLPPGIVRLNDSSYLMLIAIAEVVRPAAANVLTAAVAELHRATTRGHGAFATAVGQLDEQVKSLTRPLGAHDYTGAEMKAIRLALLDKARRGEYRDFTSAEQAFMAVETLAIQLGDDGKLGPLLDAWFATVDDEHEFDPEAFAGVAADFRNRLR